MNSHVREFLLCNDRNLQKNYTSLLKHSYAGLDQVRRNVAEWQFATARRNAMRNGTLDRNGRIPKKQFRNEPRFA